MTTSTKVLAAAVLVAIVAAAFYFLHRDEGRGDLAGESQIAMDADASQIAPDADAADKAPTRSTSTSVPSTAAAQRVTASSDPVRFPVATDPIQRVQLAAEFRVLHEGQMDVRETIFLIKSAEFDDFIGEIEQQSEDSPLAQDIGALFGDGLRAITHDTDSPVVLQRLACGMRVCAGRFDTPDEEAWKSYLVEFLANPDLRIYGLFDHSVALDNGTIEKRIVFSTDPSANKAFQRF